MKTRGFLYAFLLGIVAYAITSAAAMFLWNRAMETAHAQQPAERDSSAVPMQVIRETKWAYIFKFQDGANDCYVYEGGNAREASAISCVKR